MPDLSAFRQLLPYLWPKGNRGARLRIILAIIALVLAKVATVAVPLIYKRVTDALDGEVSALVLGAGGLVVAYGGMRLMTTGFAELRNVLWAPVGQRALRAVAAQLFGHLHNLSLRFHLDRQTGALSRIMERGVKSVDFMLRMLLFNLGPLILEILMVAVILTLALDARFLLVLVLTMTSYIAFTVFLTQRRVIQRRRMNMRDSEANQNAIDSLLNYETVKYFTAEERELMRYETAMKGYERGAVRLAKSLALLNTGQALILNLGMIAVMLMAAQGVENGTMTLGDFVMVNAYMMQLTGPLGFLGSVYREIRQGAEDMREMFSLMGEDADIGDAPGAKPLQITAGHVRFRDVKFGYAEDRQILKGVDMEVRRGEVIAVVGPSGAGKSTIGRLLFRFFDVTGGAIEIDGQDIRNVTQKSLRAEIGMVPQDTVLFNDTLGYNIGYGRDQVSDADIAAAADAASLGGFIANLPDGFETRVGERGLKLSGGEKQRVGIARTILKDPPILLLDEATSALDSETEARIQGELDDLGQGRAVIVIAHRLSTVTGADRIYVLDEGRVAESGTHADLLAAEGRYAQMWARQQAEEE
ncbi:ABCB family ABC transporter ATP-binding protein/permease [Paracoccaceae bacterium GXU_MW_L88]